MANGAIDRPPNSTLSWQCADPEGLALTYDVYFGKTNPPVPGAKIGLYTDQSGANCSFSGNQAGLVNVYVVVKPEGQGIRAVRFAAPIPVCLDATHLYEAAPSPVVIIGSSQTGISISSPFCETQPFYALQITFMSNGNTTPCCEFPIVADPVTGLLEAVDCAYATAPISDVTSHFNADASCSCGDPTLPLVASNRTTASYSPGTLQLSAYYQWRIVARDPGGLQTSGPFWSFKTQLNQPPAAPSIPTPANGAVDRPITTTLSWQCSDPEGQTIRYDVYFGTSATPPLVASNIATRSFNPGVQTFVTTYWWRVVARDTYGAATFSPTWSYTTKPENSPPAVPSNPSPASGVAGQPINTQLAWQCTDPEGQTLTYDVYFGTATNPPPFRPGISTTTIDPGLLAVSTTYRWRIVARDRMSLAV